MLFAVPVMLFPSVTFSTPASRAYLNVTSSLKPPYVPKLSAFTPFNLLCFVLSL